MLCLKKRSPDSPTCSSLASICRQACRQAQSGGASFLCLCPARWKQSKGGAHECMSGAGTQRCRIVLPNAEKPTMSSFWRDMCKASNCSFSCRAVLSASSLYAAALALQATAEINLQVTIPTAAFLWICCYCCRQRTLTELDLQSWQEDWSAARPRRVEQLL